MTAPERPVVANEMPPGGGVPGEPSLPPELIKMRDKPHGDWTIADVKRLAEQLNLTFTKPTRGSHYKVSSAVLQGILTIPFNRPIKPFYIRQFVKLAESHVVCSENQSNG